MPYTRQLHHKVAAHKCQRHQAQHSTKAHAHEADYVLDAGTFRNTPGHAEGGDTIAEMEDGSEHAKDVEQGIYGICHEIALQEFIGNRRTSDTFREDTQIEDVPYEEHNEEPCRPALQSKLPVADIAIAARVVLSLQADVDAIDGMEEKRCSDCTNFQTEENRFGDELHHCKGSVKCRSAAQGHGVGEDMLKEHHTKRQEAY